MPNIPKNNLRERMLKLGYDSTWAKITPPIVDNSRIIKSEQPKVNLGSTTSNRYNQPYTAPQTNFTPPVIANIDDWSDFEED